MKTLIAYYSRTGMNESICKMLQGKLDCELESIIDTKNRKGIWGFITGGFDAAFRAKPKIKPIEKDPTNFDLIIIATPIWAGVMVPAIRTYVFDNKTKFKKVAFVSVSGNGANNQKAVTDFENLSNQKVIASLLLSEKDVKQGIYQEKLESFVKSILEKKTEIK